MAQGFTMVGINNMQGRIQEKGENLREKIKFALEAVLSEMANWIKENHETLGGWVNRSHALEQSIDYTPATDIFDDGKIIRGSIFSGMEYAIYVEYMEGHWVITGAMEEFRNKIMKKLQEYVRAQS